MKLTAADIALQTQGNVVGNPDQFIDKVSKLEEGDSSSLGFFSNPKYEKALKETACGIVFVPNGYGQKRTENTTYIEHANPYFAFCTILAKYFNPNKRKLGISKTAVIHPSAVIGANVYIGEYCTVGELSVIGDNSSISDGCVIGDHVNIGSGSTLFPRVVIYSGCSVGRNFTAHSGTVIGSDGFGFAPVNGSYVKIPQVGNVIIEDDVELGANCCIDRATMGSTVIKKGTKLDNMVQVAHNVEIGEHTVIASQTGIAGSTKIGDHCVFGGQVGIAGHINIASHNSFGGQAGITFNVKDSYQKMSGTPAMDVNSYLRSVVAIQKLPQLLKEIESLKKEINRLKETNG
jgi:UDP-3-O-[3-hydroxymyristoyl] glucosamine N-acyltransferase